MSNKKINELASAASLSLTDLLLVGNPSSGFAYKTTLNDFKTWLGVQNIYTNDGTITGARVVTMSANSLTFQQGVYGSAGEFIVKGTSTNATVVGVKFKPESNNDYYGIYSTSNGRIITWNNAATDLYIGGTGGTVSFTNNNIYTTGKIGVGMSPGTYVASIYGTSNVLYVQGSSAGSYLAVYNSNATPLPMFRVQSTGAVLAETTDVNHRFGNLQFNNSTITGLAPITIGSGTSIDSVYFGTKNIYFTGAAVATYFNIPQVPNNGILDSIIIKGDFTNTGASVPSTLNAFFSNITAQTSIGNVTINHFGVSSVFNTTAGVTLSRGFYYNATSTGSVGLSHIAFENVTGNNYFNSSSGATGIGYASGVAVDSSLKLGVRGNIGAVYTDNALKGILSANSGWGMLDLYYGAGGSKIKLDPSSNSYITGGATLSLGSTTGHTSALLYLESTVAGLRFSNMTTAQKNLITSSASTKGVVVFDTDLGKLCVNNGSAWQTITSGP